MNVLVTGGLGFIGSNFILEFVKRFPSYKIKNIDAKLLGSHPKNLENIRNYKKYQFIQGNITNKKLIEKEVSKLMGFKFSFGDLSESDFKNIILGYKIGQYSANQAAQLAINKMNDSTRGL